MTTVIKEHQSNGHYARATITNEHGSLVVETTTLSVTVLVPILPSRHDPSRLEGHGTTRARANRIISAAWYKDATVNRYQRVNIANVPYARYDVIGNSYKVPPFLTYPGNTPFHSKG